MPDYEKCNRIRRTLPGNALFKVEAWTSNAPITEPAHFLDIAQDMIDTATDIRQACAAAGVEVRRPASLVEDLAAASGTLHRGKKCSLKATLDECSAEDRQAVYKALRAGDVSPGAIVEVAARYGVTLSKYSLRWHRAHGCLSCNLPGPFGEFGRVTK